MRSLEKELHTEVKEVFQFSIQHLQSIRLSIEEDVMENADTAYALKKCEEYCDTIRKECKKLREQLEKIVCLTLLQNEQAQVKTPYVTATVNAKVNYPVPKKLSTPEAYENIMKYFDIPDWVHEREIMRIHWPGLNDYCNELNREGKQLPPGISNTDGQAHFGLKLRTRKEPS